MQLKNGTELQGGRYRIEKILGQGGFGITYLAEQTGLGRKVAIKEFFMKEFCNRNAETSQVSVGSKGSSELVERFREKFLKEARRIASLEHKNIVPVIDVFEENGTAYYVMKYMGGGSLSDKVAAGALPEADALRYIRQIASALDFVHGKLMMHLDVKPANVLLSDDDEAVLIDFGLAKQYDDAGTQTSTTPVGISHGYAPMEQYKRGGVGTFSPATDIYSLGATLYKLVTGNTPPEANDVANDGLPELPQHLSSNVRAAIEAAMQFRLKERPQSIGEFLEIVESGKLKVERGEMKDDSDGVEDCPPVLRGTSAAEGVNDSSATDDGATVVGNSSGSCHPERSEPSVDARRGQSQGSYKHANREILPPSGRQNDNSGEWRDESGKRRDESGKWKDDIVQGTNEGDSEVTFAFRDKPSTSPIERSTEETHLAGAVISSASEKSQFSGSCHPERSEPSVDARRGQSQGTHKHANREILPPSGRQNDNSGKMRDESGEVKDESGEMKYERKGLGGTSKKKWAIIIAVLVIGAVAALLGTLSGGGSDDTAAERERLAAIAEEQRIEAERLAAEQQRLEQERLAQEAQNSNA
ncbi:MAG: serine/threonine protein kinase [Bacteroidaceae bacterium]|nr:serine/threonine protein kinase [Bacteroidaceae bacterium]